MSAPKSTREFGKVQNLIWIVTTGFPRSLYLTGTYFPKMRSDNVPITLTVGGFLGFLPRFLLHNYLIVLA